MCLMSNINHYNSSTVKNRSAKYAVAEQNRGADAEELIRKSGFYSPNTLADMLQHGAYKNCGLTRHDIERGVDIMGR